MTAWPPHTLPALIVAGAKAGMASTIMVTMMVVVLGTAAADPIGDRGSSRCTVEVGDGPHDDAVLTLRGSTLPGQGW